MKTSKGDTSSDTKPKEFQLNSNSKTQADLGVGADPNPNIGSTDLNKP